MKKSKTQNQGATNRRAFFDYALGEEIVTGMSLSGKQVRAARDGRVQLKGSYVTERKGSLWLNNSSWSLKVNEPGGGNVVFTEPVRLLATKKQIESLKREKVNGMTIVPVRMLTTGRYIKLVIALGKGKKTYDKRHAIKKRDLERENKVKL